ncbi:MAG: alpha/beta fold hydrolase, partial [Deltaproteobacteria bacterium]
MKAFLFLTAILLIPLPLHAADGAGGIELSDCHLSMPGSSRRIPARCGTLEVPENREAPDGRKIALRVAVLEALSRNPKPDPLFFLAGGPGQAASEAYIGVASAFRRLQKRRDIVLVDQRGTGGSNRLDCKSSEEEPSIEIETNPEKLRAWAMKCRDALSEKADLTRYTTTIAMQDLDAVRQALGYERINLYGISYGTRAALTYIKNFPEHVRTAVLDGVVPQDEALGISAARDAQRALSLLFERCDDDETCRTHFPELRRSFDDLLARFEGGAVPVELDHPITAKRISFPYTREAFAWMIRMGSYADTSLAILPLLLHHSHETGDFRRIAAQSLMLDESLAHMMAMGMSYSVTCSEDWPMIDRETAERINEGSYMGMMLIDALDTVCASWPRGKVPPDFKEPVHATMPVLLLSGEADPVTPPENAEEVAR